MTEAVDPDPYDSGEQSRRSALGGREEPTDGDPTAGGKRGEVGQTGSVAADEPDDGGPAIAPGGGHVSEDSDAAPASDPGPDA